MSIRKTLIAGLALAVAVAFSPLPELQAATFVNPGSQPGTDNLAQSVKTKRKAKPQTMKRHRKHRKAKRAGSKDYHTGAYDGGPAARPAPPAPAATRKQIASVEERMEKLSSLLAKVDAALADGSAFASEPKRAKLLAKQRGELKAALARAEEEWLEASDAAR